MTEDKTLPVERVIGEEGLSAGPGEMRLAMRLPWYRSLPFSTVFVDALTLDGKPVDLAQAVVETEGERFSLSALAEETNRFWFVLDSAFLVIPGEVKPRGAACEVSLTLSLHPPYIPGMKRTNAQTATLTVH